MSRIAIFMALVASLFLTGLSASAGERRVIHHRHHHMHAGWHGGVSAGISFRAEVYVRPQIVIDRPKIARPIIHYRKMRMIRPAKGCSVKQASAIAREFGIRYQTIIRNRNTMLVVGYNHGKKAKILLSRAPGCAILD